MDLEWQIQDAGHIVVGTAVDLASCRKIADNERPDIALMDMRLKNGDSGEDAARWLRDTLDIACVFISGNLDEVTRDRLSKLGPAAFIGKPILKAKLIDTLKRFSVKSAF